jgi:hypothetical protein
MSTHSEKALTTLRLMNAKIDGWKVARIDFKLVLRKVPTKVRCPTCHGTGQVGEWNKKERCPTCPARTARWWNYGTGEITELREREVLVGIVRWPKGTLFTSRFGDGGHCALCNKAIYSAFSWCPVVGETKDGHPIGMWIGTDCAKKILSVKRDADLAFEGTPNGAAEITAWKEKPKEKTPAKPKPPALDTPTPRNVLEALVRDEFDGSLGEHMNYWTSRGGMEFNFYLLGGQHGATGVEVKVSARHGSTVRIHFGDEKPFFKDKTVFEADVALRAALPEIRKRFGLAAK